MEVNFIDKKFWKGKNIFITGHNGFVGSWLCCALEALNVKKITGYSLRNNKKNSLFNNLNFKNNLIKSINADINNYKKLQESISFSKPDIVIHLAAQPIVNIGYEYPLNTFATNILGTANLLNILRSKKYIKSILIITSDKVYKNLEKTTGYKETDHLGGYDPYSASKAAAEIITESMKLSFFEKDCGIATSRAGNIIGGGDWSEDRILPDIVNSLNRKKNIQLRYPNAIRPWQHVLDAINGYLILLEKLTKKPKKYSSSWNFGPLEKNVSVKELTKKSIEYWKSEITWQGLSTKKYETKNLNLNIKKSRSLLNWSPKLKTDQSIKLTIDWYKSFYDNVDINKLTKKQVYNYFYDNN